MFATTATLSLRRARGGGGEGHYCVRAREILSLFHKFIADCQYCVVCDSVRLHGSLFGPRVFGQLDSSHPTFLCQSYYILYFPTARPVCCRAVPTHTHNTIRSKLRQRLTHTVLPRLTDPFPNISRPASAAEDDEVPGGTWSPLLMLLPGEDSPQRARRDGLKAGVQHRVLQPRVVPDSIT